MLYVPPTRSAMQITGATRYAAGVDFDPKTVGDDIRVMEPEQLAELLSIRFCNGQQKQECLDWLNTCIDKPNKT